MHPGTLIPDVGHLEKIRVESGLRACALEYGHMSPRRAGGNHHPIQAVFPDRADDLADARFRTCVEIVFREDHVGKRCRVLGQRRAIQVAGYVRSAMAYENPYPRVLSV